MSKLVRYGDQIYIEINNLEPPPETETRVLASNGFLEEKVYGVKSKSFSKANFRTCVFTILPSLVDSMKDLNTLQAFGTELAFLSTNKPDTLGEIFLQSEIQSKGEQIELSKDILEALNKKIMTEMDNNSVCFGEIVLLQHLESGYFLCAETNSHSKDPHLYNLKLQKERNAACYFRFFSYSDGLDRGPLNYESEMKLMSVHLKSAVTMGKTDNHEDNPEFLQGYHDNNKNSEVVLFPSDTIKREKSINLVYPGAVIVGTALESDDNNKITLSEFCCRSHQLLFNKNKMIKNGDYIRLQLDDFYLTASKRPYRTNFGLYSQQTEDCKYSCLNSVFQIIEVKTTKGYPIGSEIFTNAKQMENEVDSDRYYLKHFATGQYLSIPKDDAGLFEFSVKDMGQDSDNIPYFRLINSHRINEKDPLTQNSRACLQSFKGNSNVGEYYLESKLEKYEISQLDTNITYFVGFRNTEDKIKDSLKLVKKSIKSSEAVGSFFKVTSVGEEEMRWILECESYANALSRFMAVLKGMMGKNEKVNPLLFASELRMCLKHVGKLIDLLNTKNAQIQTIAREFCIFDVIIRFFYYFFTSPDIELVMKSRKFEIKEAILFLKKLSIIILNATKNELNHSYLSQYVRVFIFSLYEPSSFFKVCDQSEAEILKDNVVFLLNRFLWDQDYDTLGQLTHYQAQLFACLDKHSDYSVHLLKVLAHYFSSKCPNLENTLKQDFISVYLSDPSRLNKIFPKFTHFPKENDFELSFEREGYPSTMKLSEAPPEVQRYIKWVFRLINSIAQSRSYKFARLIIDQYSEELCEQLVNLPHVSAAIKNEILRMLRNIHASYWKLPFNAIPPEVQLLMATKKRDKYLEEFGRMIQGFRQEFEDNERSLGLKQVESKLDAGKFSLHQVSLDLLRGEFNKIQNGNLDSLSFTLEVMRGLLQEESNLDIESLYIIYHSLATIIDKTSKELEKKQDSLYFRAFNENAEKIFSVLSYVDKHVARLAFKEAISNIKSQVLEVKNGNITPYSIMKEKHGATVASSQAVIEDQIMQAILNSMSKEWKSKTKLYLLAGKYMDIYSEGEVMKALWRIIEVSDDPTLTNFAVILIKEKTTFESNIASRLFECVLMTEDSEVSEFQKLTSNLLNLSKIGRKLLLIEEFNLEIKEDENTIDEIIQCCENIFLTVYDYYKHMRKEDNKITEPEAREIFLNRIRFSKSEQTNEIPFKYRSSCIKPSYQKIMSVLQTHEILAPYFKRVCFRKSFLSVADQKIRSAMSLIAIILIVFLYKNTDNQNLLSRYNEFITCFYKKEVLNTSNEATIVLAELCRNNKKLLKMTDEHLFKPYAYTLVEYMGRFSVENASNANSSAPINHIRSLSVLFTANLPQDLFDPVEVLKEKFTDLSDFISKDNKLSLNFLLKNKQVPGLLDNLQMEKNNIFQTPLDMPVEYMIIKELLENGAVFALTDMKERAMSLQSVFNLEKLSAFLMNENICFNFELKQLVLNILENLYFKNKSKINSIFPDYHQFLSLVSVLFVDAYQYFKAHIADATSILEMLSENAMLDEQSEKCMKDYEKISLKDLDDIGFLQYQSLVSFERVWKDYIYYILCDLFGKFIVKMREFMLEKTDTDELTHNIFDVWLVLIRKLREISEGPEQLSRIDETLKSVIIYSEYSKYRDLIYSIVGPEIKLTQNRSSLFLDQNNWRLDLNYLLNKHLGEKATYKRTFSRNNINNIVKHLALEKVILNKLVLVLQQQEVPIKEITFVLRLFRHIIETAAQVEENKEKPIYRWNHVPYAELKKVFRHQNVFNELNLVKVLFSLFHKHSTNKLVLKEVLLLSIALLYGGNKRVQDSFFENFKDDYKNEIIDQLVSLLESSLEVFIAQETQHTKAAQLHAIKFIFDYLIDHPKAEIVINGTYVQIPAKLKEDISLSYQLYLKEKKVDNGVLADDVEISLIILKFFQTLCEGHYFNFQEYLRDQTTVGHVKSSNILEFLRQTYHVFHKEIRIDNAEIADQILALLTELEQGESQENVNHLLRKTCIHDLCYTLHGFNNDLDLLARGFQFNPNHPQFMMIKAKALGILKDLVERSDTADLTRMRKEINLRALVSTFKENVVAFHNKKGTYPTKEILLAEDVFDPNLSNAFTTYFILKHLSFEETADQLTPEIQELLEKVFSNEQGISKKTGNLYITKFFKQYTGNIEILKKKSSRIMKIYFPISVTYYYLKQESKFIFSENVDRTNMQTKVAGLMEGSKELISQIYDEYEARNSFLGLNFTNLYNWLRMLTNALGLTITLFNLFQLEWVNSSVSYKDNASIAAQKAINSIQSVISFALILLWIRAKLRTHLAFKWDEYNNRKVKREGELSQDIIQNLDYIKITPEIGELVLDLKGPYSEEWQSVKDIMMPKLYLYNCYFLFHNLYFLWHLCYFGICVGSSFHPLVTAFQLFDIVIRSDTVNRITLSISKNAKQFLWTLVLLFVTVYIYSFIGFYFLHERYYNDDVGDLCQDGYSCLLASLDYGLRAGGGIADVLQKVQYDPDERGIYFGQVLFDLTFFILMITLLLNLIFGMIIDAFGELRDEKTRNEDDKLNICFICGLSRSEYERTASFDKHIFEEHNMWQYLTYIIYLQEKNKAFATELTDVESYVLDRYNKKDYAWLPLGRSLSLERHFEREEKEKRTEIDILKDEMVGVIQTVVEQNKHVINLLMEMQGNKNEENRSSIINIRQSHNKKLTK